MGSNRRNFSSDTAARRLIAHPGELRRAATRSATLAVAFCVGAVTIIWFAMLGGRALFDPDEGRYAEIPREMLINHDWIIPHLNGLVYLEKPPLQYWLTALSFLSFGTGEFTARLCTGVAGYLSLLVVFLLGTRLWGVAAGYKAAMFMSASMLFVLLGHQLTLDMLLSFSLLCVLACFLMAQTGHQSSRGHDWWMLGCWVAMGLAVLSKGLIGVVAPAATGVAYSLWQGDRRMWSRLNLRYGVPAFLAIVLPWFVLAARANADFLRFFIVREHFERFLTPVEHRSEPWWFFLVVLLLGILPWAPAAMRAMLLTIRMRSRRGQFDAGLALAVWCLFLFIFFSFSNAKLIPYILPIVPALALLSAQPGFAGRVSIALGAAVSLLAGGAILVTLNLSWQTWKVAAVIAAAHTALGCTGALLALASLATLAILRRQRDGLALSVLCAAWFLASVLVLIGATDSQEAFSAKTLAQALRAAAAADAPGTPPPVFSVQLYDQSLPFYLGRTVTLVGYRDEFALGLDENPALSIADMSDFSERWLQLQQGYAIMRPLTRDLLLAQGLPLREVGRFRNRVIESRR